MRTPNTKEIRNDPSASTRTPLCRKYIPRAPGRTFANHLSYLDDRPSQNIGAAALGTPDNYSCPDTREECTALPAIGCLRKRVPGEFPRLHRVARPHA